MAKFTDTIIAALKAYFETGDAPTAAQFAELIDDIHAGFEEHEHPVSAAATGDGPLVPAVNRRQGGSASNWTTAGTTSYTPARSIIQCGARAATIGNTSVVITFPVAYNDPPLLWAQVGNSNAITVTVASCTPTACTLTLSSAPTGALAIGWLALGYPA
jgi:hypothetical protein